jgi:NADH:ubiquinone reductase (H+-translocating)
LAGRAVAGPLQLGKRRTHGWERMGVEIQLGTTVTDVDRDGLTVKDADSTIRRIESACNVWSAGVSASPLGNRLVAAVAFTDSSQRIHSNELQ